MQYIQKQGTHVKPNLMEMCMGGGGAACLCGGAAGPDSASSAVCCCCCVLLCADSASSAAAFSLPASLRQSYLQPLPWEQSSPLSAKRHNTPIQPTTATKRPKQGCGTLWIPVLLRGFEVLKTCANWGRIGRIGTKRRECSRGGSDAGKRR